MFETDPRIMVKMALDAVPVAQQLEDSLKAYLAPVPLGLYLPDGLKPILIPEKRYLLKYKDTAISPKDMALVTIEELRQVPLSW